jgi:hypothetical protein
MVRARRAKCRSLLAAGLTAVALAAGAPAAVAAPAAAEEYVLTLPGVDKTSVGAATTGEGPSDGAAGIVGEQDESETTAALVASAMVSPAGLGIVLPALAVACVALVARRRMVGRADRT